MENDWFVSNTWHPDADVTIAAFPQAGAGCAVFSQHAKAMPDWLELKTLNLPGRQARFTEPVRTDIDALAEELALYWANQSKPYLFFGYCSGALIAYCVARRLQELGATLPERLVVSSYKAPHLVSSGPLGDLDSDQFWASLLAYNVVAPVVAAHRELREIMEPVIRGDMELVAGYRHVPCEPLAIPITMLSGERDTWITAADVAAWERYTAQGLTASKLPASHWFMEENAAAATQALIAEAAAVRG
jgi:medium-chain acyl-[acyl-carrier-protein] hydrolase